MLCTRPTRSRRHRSCSARTRRCHRNRSYGFLWCREYLPGKTGQGYFLYEEFSRCSYRYDASALYFVLLSFGFAYFFICLGRWYLHIRTSSSWRFWNCGRRRLLDLPGSGAASGRQKPVGSSVSCIPARTIVSAACDSTFQSFSNYRKVLGLCYGSFKAVLLWARVFGHSTNPGGWRFLPSQ